MFDRIRDLKTLKTATFERLYTHINTNSALTGWQVQVYPCNELVFMAHLPLLWHGLDWHRSTINSQCCPTGGQRAQMCIRKKTVNLNHFKKASMIIHDSKIRPHQYNRDDSGTDSYWWVAHSQWCRMDGKVQKDTRSHLPHNALQWNQEGRSKCTVPHHPHTGRHSYSERRTLGRIHSRPPHTANLQNREEVVRGHLHISVTSEH